jgi:hypothetical protein
MKPLRRQGRFLCLFLAVTLCMPLSPAATGAIRFQGNDERFTLIRSAIVEWEHSLPPRLVTQGQQFGTSPQFSGVRPRVSDIKLHVLGFRFLIQQKDPRVLTALPEGSLPRVQADLDDMLTRSDSDRPKDPDLDETIIDELSKIPQANIR